jgi:biopolymer transport protein ExbD/biopolymer transport protein TolR
MSRRRRNRDALQISSEINVVALIDLAFNLLVIFMITAPMMAGGVEVQVPRASSESIATPEGIVVSMTLDGALYIGDAQATWEEFEPALTDAVREQQATAVYLRADQGIEYGNVLRVLGAMKSLDIASVGLVADPDNRAPGGSRR